jgi:hypothetical protein
MNYLVKRPAHLQFNGRITVIIQNVISASAASFVIDMEH